MPHGPSSLILYKPGSESWGGCVCMHMCVHVCTPLVSAGGWGGSCILALCILLWADGICLALPLCQVTHPSAMWDGGSGRVFAFLAFA